MNNLPLYKEIPFITVRPISLRRHLLRLISQLMETVRQHSYHNVGRPGLA
jgi:hypothetical protein